jgi:hypothetical protein
MSKDRRKAQDTDAAGPLAGSALPETTKKWRRLVRIRNRFFVGWLGGIAVEMVLFPMMGVFPAVKYQILAATGALTVCWFGSCCALLALGSSIEAHIQQTFSRNDQAGLACWIDLLLMPTRADQVAAWGYPQLMNPPRQQLARQAILEQLPRLQEETAHLLSIDERHALYKTLSGFDTEMAFAVLQALPLFGDARALPFVQPLAEGRGVAAGNPELQAAAQSSLDRLQANLALSSGAQGLLRASHRPHPPEEELLKPASAYHATPADELLRADIRKDNLP